MLAAITLLFACQLVGETLVAILGLPLPGPVAGMLLLLAGLLFYGEVPAELAMVGDGFLSNLSLLFVPAGVGVMLHGGLIGRDGIALSIALVLSTAAAVGVTGVLMSWLSTPDDGDEITSKPASDAGS